MSVSVAAAVPSAPATPVWQNPYVEVIRYSLAHRSVGYHQQGDVDQVTDNQIHKNVFKIRGTIAATNYLRIPREISKSSQGLGLTGRYIYIQLRRARSQQITLHLDLLTTKKTALRFSLSSMYSSLRSSGTVLRVPLELDETWTTIAIDLVEMLQLHSFNGHSRESHRYLKAVTCCASMNLRNIFTSSTAFTPQNIPSHLALSAAHENQNGPFVWLTLPMAEQRKIVRSHIKQHSIEEVNNNNSYDGSDGDDDHDSDGYAAVSPIPTTAAQLQAPPPAPQAVQSPTVAIVDASAIGGLPLSPTSRETGLLRDREDVLTRADQILRDAGFSVPSPRRAVSHSAAAGHQASALAASMTLSPRRFLASEQSDWPDPILSLTRIIGFSNAFAKALRWLPDASACVYASHSTIVIRSFALDLRTHGDGHPNRLVGLHHPTHHDASVKHKQRSQLENQGMAPSDNDHEVFLTGHTGEICALEVSRDGALLASAQNIPHSVLRVWDLRRYQTTTDCIVVIKAPTKSIHVLAFSQDSKSLCCVGMDDHARTQLFVWDCSRLLDGGNWTTASSTSASTAAAAVRKLVLKARQTCDFPIHAIAFSPYEADQLVSCGKENVRFWRIHGTRHHLPGTPVILKEYSRGTVFTDLGFDCVYPQFPSNLPRLRPLYVSSSVGTVLVINYDTREVVCVYKLHDAAIHSLSINEGFCVTGSDDKFLRVWPLDFSDFFLEAEHEAPVKSVDVSADGMRVIVGTASGAIGLLHLADQEYRTVLRSHTQPVHTIATLPDGLLVSSANDGTLRVWDTITGSQTMEFDVSRDHVTCLVAMPGNPQANDASVVIAVGFRSGCTRIFALQESGENGGDGGNDGGSAPGQPRVVHEFQQHQSALCDVQYQSDGKTLFTSGEGRQLCMYDVDKGYTPTKMLIADIDTTTPSGGSGSGKLCLSRDGRYLAVLQCGRRSVLLLDAVSLCVVRVLTPPSQPANMSTNSKHSGEDRELTQVAISWNSHELLAISKDDRLFIFSLAEETPGGGSGGATRMSVGAATFGALIHSMPLLGQRGIASFALSPNFKYMATGGSDGSVRVWQCDFGKHNFQRMHQTFLLHAGPGAVWGAEFSSDGEQVFATSESSNAVFVWRFRGNTSQLPTLQLSPSNQLDDGQEANKKTYVPVPGSAKPEFQLPLDTIKDNAQASIPSRSSSAGGYSLDKPMEIVKMELSTTRSLAVHWKVIGLSIDPSPHCYVWSCTLGCLVSTAADRSVVVLEMLESGERHCLRMSDRVERLVLSPSHTFLAVVLASLDAVLVYDLSKLRGKNGSQLEQSGDSHLVAQRVAFPPRLRELHALEFSVDNQLLCLSGDLVSESKPSLFIVDIRRGGDIVSQTTTSHPLAAGPVTSIFAQSGHEFLCAKRGDPKCLETLRLPTPTSSTDVTLEPAANIVLPSDDRFLLLCFRDDGIVADDHRDHTRPRRQRCRFYAAIDRDACCYFVDLDRQQVQATVQLVFPSASSSRMTSMHWVGSDDWQAIVVTLDHTTIAAFALPMKFSSSAKTLGSVDWSQLKRIGRLACKQTTTHHHVDHGITQILVDPFRDVGLIVAQDGVAFVVNFRTAQRRLLRPHAIQMATPTNSCGIVARPQFAMHGAFILTLSADRHAIQCWEPTTGRELARLDVRNVPCDAFTVSSFDPHLVVAGYSDGSIRIFNVAEQRLAAQCVLPPRNRSGLSSNTKPSAASPVEALSILKHRQLMKRSGVKHPSAAAVDHSRAASSQQTFQELCFLGPRCVLVAGTTPSELVGDTTATSPRLVLLDFSEISLASVATASTSKNNNGTGQSYKDTTAPAPVAPRKAAKETKIQYREILMPGPDRKLRASASPTKWEMQIEGVDVQPATNERPRRARGNSNDEATMTTTAAFLVVVRTTTNRELGRVARLVHVYDGSGSGHPVFSDDDVAPCDSWVIATSTTTPSPTSVIFHPTNRSQVIYVITAGEPALHPCNNQSHHVNDDDDAREDTTTVPWLIEVRDFRAHCGLLRIAMPTGCPYTIQPTSVVNLQRCRVQGKSFVMVSKAKEHGGSPGWQCAVDLAKRMHLHVDQTPEYSALDGTMYGVDTTTHCRLVSQLDNRQTGDGGTSVVVGQLEVMHT